MKIHIYYFIELKIDFIQLQMSSLFNDSSLLDSSLMQEEQ